MGCQGRGEREREEAREARWWGGGRKEEGNVSESECSKIDPRHCHHHISHHRHYLICQGTTTLQVQTAEAGRTAASPDFNFTFDLWGCLIRDSLPLQQTVKSRMRLIAEQSKSRVTSPSDLPSLWPSLLFSLYKPALPNITLFLFTVFVTSIHSRNLMIPHIFTGTILPPVVKWSLCA